MSLARTDGQGSGGTQITYTVNGGAPITTNGRSMNARNLTGPSVTFVILNVSASVPYAPQLNGQSSVTVSSPF